MSASWFRKLGKRPSQRRERRSAADRLRLPYFERFEKRMMPATVTWINPNGGDWDVAANWSGGAVPGVNDDVVINQPGGATITHTATTADSANSVTSSDPIALSNGTLTVSGNVSVSAAFTIGGSNTRLKSATLASGTTLDGSAGGATLDGVTVASGATFKMSTASSVSTTVVNGFTVNGQVVVDAKANGGGAVNLVASGNETIGGSGLILLGDSASSMGNLNLGGGGNTVTLGPQLTVRAVGRGQIGQGSASTLINQGTIEVVHPTAGAATSFNVSVNSFTNAATGVFRVTDALDTVAFSVNTSQTVTNLGSFSATAGNLTIAGSWSSSGTIAGAAGATINLGGAFTTAGLGTFTAGGATVNLTGALTNTGSTLTLDPSTLGTWNLVAGTITGGTVATQNGAQILVTSNTGTFTGVTLAAGSDVVLSTNATLNFGGGLTDNGRITVLSNSVLQAIATETLDGTGEVKFSLVQGGVPSLVLANSGTTLTLGSGLLVHGNNFDVRGPSLGTPAPNETVIDNATVVCDATPVQAQGVRFLTNLTTTPSSHLQVTDPAGIISIISPVWTDQSPITVAAGSTWNLSAASWTNQSTITQTGGILNLGGGFTTAGLGTFTRTGGTAGTVNLVGILTNTGATLTLDPTNNGFGSWNLGGNGAIVGGTVVTQNGAQLVALQNTSGSIVDPTLTGVTLAAGSDLLISNNAEVILSGGFTDNGRVTITSGDFRVDTTETVDGTGEIKTAYAGSGSPPGFDMTTPGTTLTAGPGLTIHGNSFFVWRQSATPLSDRTFVLDGTLTEDAPPTSGFSINIYTNLTTAPGSQFQVNVPTGTVAINSPTWLNQTAVTVAMGTWSVNSTTYANQSQINQTGGVLNLGGAFTLAGLGTLTRAGGTAGTVNLLGALANTGTTLTLDTANNGLGTWNIGAGGAITGGTVVTRNGAVLAAPATVVLSGVASPTLTGVTLAAGSDLVLSNSANVVLAGGFTDNGRVTVSSGILVINATETVDGTGEFKGVYAGSGNVPAFQLNNAGVTLTVGAGLLIHGNAFGIIGSSNSPVGDRSAVVNATITADAPALNTVPFRFYTNLTTTPSAKIQTTDPGASIDIESPTWLNQSAVTLGGGTLTVNSASWTNAGVITVNSGTFVLGGGFTQAALGTVVRNGGAFNLTGTVTGDLTLDNNLGSWNFVGGTIKNGTFRTAAGSTATLIGTTTIGTLDNVTLASPLDMSTNNQATVVVKNGLTLNTSQPVGSPTGTTLGIIEFSGLNTVRSTGSGEFVLGAHASNQVKQVNNGDVLTIGAGVVIRGTAGTVGIQNGTIINEGTIRSEGGAGKSLGVFIGNLGRNDGTITAVGGSSIIVAATANASWTNVGTLSVDGGGTLQLGQQTNESWTNIGKIAATNSSTVKLDGAISQAQVGPITHDAGSTVRIDTNALFSGDLRLTDATGNWLMGAGTLQNGTISSTGSARLILSGSVTFTKETIAGGLDLTTNSTFVTFVGGLTVNTVLNAGDAAGASAVTFLVGSDQTWGGTGAIVFGGGSNRLSTNTSNSLTIAAGLTLRGKTVAVSSFPRLVVAGTIGDDVAGGVFDVNPQSFTNNGLVTATNGGEVRVHPSATLTNYANVTQTGTVLTGTLVGGAWSAGAGSTLRVYKDNSTVTTFTQLDAAVTLDGGGSNVFGGPSGGGLAALDALASVHAISPEGSLTVSGGRTFSPVGNFTNAGTLTVGPGSSVVPTNGLVSRYSGEFTTLDATGRNNATAPNGVSYAPGLSGEAFAFNGTSSYVTVADSPSLRLASFTIDAYVNFSSLDSALHTIVGKEVGTGDNDSAGIYFQGGNFHAAVGDASGFSGDIGVTLAPTVGTWYHTTLTYDGPTRTLRLFVSGGGAGGTNALTATRSPAYDTHPWVIGGDQTAGAFSYPFNGLIDEVSFSNRVLYPGDVAGQATVPALSYTQTSGTTTVNGTFLAPGETFNLQGGTLKGVGTVNADVVNAGGTVAPGNSPGFLDVTGNYTQTAAGVLSLEIAGRDPDVPEYDRLRVTGTATLDGTLHVDLLNDFEPAPGDAFEVITSAQRVGQFATLDLPAPGGAGRRFVPAYDPLNLNLLVQLVPPLNFGFAATGAGAANDPAVDRFTPLQVALDEAGDSYVVGTYQGTVEFDREVPGHVLTSANLAGFVAKYDPIGNLLWVHSVDGGTAAAASALVVDTRGTTSPDDDDVYVTGRYAGSAAYPGATSLTGQGGTSAFLLKTDAAGNALAFSAIDATSAAGAVSGERITLGPTGDVFVSGSFAGTADFDPGASTFPLSENGNGGGDAFVAEYTPAFGFVRAARIGSAGADGAQTDVAVDSSGDVWLTGGFTGTTTGLAALTSAGSTDTFLLELHGNGTSFATDLARSYGSVGSDTPSALAVDALGNVLLAGDFQFSVNFDPTAGHAFTLVSGGDADGFIVKLDGHGTFLWARDLGGYRNDNINDLATDAQGNVYTTGLFTERVDFDPLDGTYVLATNPATNSQAFLSKLDPQGRFVWAAQLGDEPGASSDGFGLAVDSTGRVVSVGTFGGQADFDPGLGVQSRTFTAGNAGSVAGYLSYLTQEDAPQAAVLGLPAGAVAEGTTLALAAGVTDPDSVAFTYAWSVSQGSTTLANGKGKTFSDYLATPGVYTLTLTVTDESGNASTVTSTITVNDAPPVLNTTTFSATPVVTSEPGPVAGDAFGSVVVTGNGQTLVGAPKASSAAGRAYVYDATTGAFVRSLASPSPASGDGFGSAVAAVGGYDVVGAPGASGSGRVFVFNATTGALVATLSGPAGVAGDRFGAAVAAVGNLVAVGAPGRSVAGASGAGEAYLFDPASGTLAQTFRNPSPAAGDAFGTAVAAAGSGVLVGSPGDDASGLDSGAAYLLDPGTGKVTATLQNPNPGFAGSGFGSDLAASGLRGLVGAPLDASAGAGAGGAFLFDLDPSSPTFGMLLKTLRSPNTAGHFGASVAFAGNRALVGADVDNQTVAASGTAFLYDLDPSSATYGAAIATFKKASPAAGERFGGAVAFAGGDVLVAAPQDNSGGAGGLFRFAATGTVTLSSATINENDVLTISGSFSDPGAGDAHTLVVDWNDGSAVTTVALPAGVTQFTASHRYLNNSPVGVASAPLAFRVKVLDVAADVVSAVPGPARVDRFDGTTGAAEGTFVPAGAGGLTNASAAVVGPDGDLYVSGGGPGANPVLRYDGATGAFAGTFLAAGLGGTTSASGLAFGPDGSLFYADQAGNRVFRRDRKTGAFAPFVAAGLGGLSAPRGLAFGPDGNLYVASSGNNEILRYDGTTGAFLSAFVPPGSGLNVPTALAFTPAGELLVLSVGGTSASILRFDAATGASTGDFAHPAVTGATGGWLRLGSDDSLYAAFPGGAVYRYDTSSGVATGQLTSTSGGPLAGLAPQAEANPVVTINDVKPTADVVPAANPSGVPASAFTLSAAVTDPGSLDVEGYAWSITGGAVVTGTPTNAKTFSFTTSGAAVVTLTVTDDDGLSGTVKVEVVAETSGNDTVAVTNSSVTVAGVVTSLTSGVTRVIVYGLAGDDLIDASADSTFPVDLIGGAGNDTLVGGTMNDLLVGNTPGDYALGHAGDTGADSLVGGAGDDTLDGGLGNDTMAGGVGNDFYVEVPGSDDLLVEPSGTAGGVDTVDYSQAYFGITFSLTQTGVAQPVNPAAGTSTVTILGDFENLNGSPYGDKFYGNSLNNTINGGGGDDLLYGTDTVNPTPGVLYSGNDSLVGGGGNDTIQGGNGNDIIYGGDPANPGTLGNTSIVGGGGNDTIHGGAGNDIIYGGDPANPGTLGNTSISGGGGNDTIHGGAGNDIIYGGDPANPGTLGNTSISGGGGNDTIRGGAGNDIIYGGDPANPGTLGNTSIVGGGGNDTIRGGAGNDIIYGGDPANPGTLGNTSISGGGGNDTIHGGAGNDIIYGGDPANPGTLGNTSIMGGGGNDTIRGGAGNDIIYGGDPANPGSLGNTSIMGGGGNDTIRGGAGNDIIYGGDPSNPNTLGNTSIVGGGGNDTIRGGAGNDIIYGGDPANPGTLGDTSIVGGGGNDTIRGGAGNDIIYGGDPANPGTLGNTSISGGAGNDTIRGGAGNDIIFGGPGDDLVSGGGGINVVDGGSGVNTVSESADADMTLGPTTITIGGQVERIYDVGQADLVGGPGNNVLDASAFPGPVTLDGGAGDDTLIGTPFGDDLIGESGNDTFVGNGGDDVFDLGPGSKTATGGDGNDTYIVRSGASVLLNDSGGIDSLDFSDADYGINLDLTLSTAQTLDAHGTVVTLNGAFENVRGSGYNDTIKGSADRNILDGGGGVNYIAGGDGDDTLQGSFPRLVYLSFNPGVLPGVHDYTVDERNAIQAGLEALYSAPFSIKFTQTRPSVGEYTTVYVNAGQSQNNEVLVGGQSSELNFRDIDALTTATVDVNGFLGHRGQPAATVANYDALTLTIVAHELGHLLGLQHGDSFGPIGVDPQTGLPYGIYAGLVAKSAVRNETDAGSPTSGGNGAVVAYPFGQGPVLLGPVTYAGQTQPTYHPAPSGTIYDGTTPAATFVVDAATGKVVFTAVNNGAGLARTVVGGTFDPVAAVLTVTWSSAPAKSSAVVSYDYDPFRPGYTGPIDATETNQHVMASPASVGTTVTDSINAPYFGERELIKLAFDDASTTYHSSDLATTTSGVPASLGGKAFALGTLPALAVPNLLPSTAVNAGKTLNVRATSVVGAITIDPSTGNSTTDVYAFQGHAGEFLNAEILSASLRDRFGSSIDGILRVYDASGHLVSYYGQPAVSDDGFDGNVDPDLIDVPLPADGTYYVQVDTYFDASVPHTDTGGYELFLYTYTDPTTNTTRLGGAGDTIIAGSGVDTVIGSAGDDAVLGAKSADTLIGVGPYDAVFGDNQPPTASPDAYVASEGSVLTVSAAAGVLVNDHDPANLPLTAHVGTGPSHGTLNLNPDGSFTYTPAPGYAGPDAFTYTANDGALSSSPATVSLNVTQVGTTVSGAGTYGSPSTLAATLTQGGSGVAGDVVTFAVNGANVGSATTDATGTATLAVPPAGFNAGTYGVTATFAAAGSYGGGTATGTLVVAKASATLSLSNLSATYDGSAHAATVTVTPAGLSGVSVNYTLGGVAVSSPVSAGTYLVRATLSNPNYAAADASGTLVIARATTQLTWARPAAVVYGTPLGGSQLDASATIPGTFAYTPDFGTVLNAGVGQTLSVFFTPTDANDYAPASAATTIDVTPATLLVTPASLNKTYGATLPTLVAGYSGFVNGDDATSLTTPPTLATTATAASHAGTYAITASGASAANYQISYATGTLTVTPAPLGVTAAPAAKVYGAALPSLTATYSGFVNGDTPSSLTTPATASTAATSASHAGTYAINVSGASDPDYAINYTAGTLTVTPAALTITAGDQGKAYGAGLPAFTVGYQGFVNGDTPASLSAAPTVTTTATAASHAGTYAITASGAVDPDYAIGYTNGTLTVTPVALAITADDQGKSYGAALPALTASYRGFVNGDTPSSLTTPATLTTAATSASHVGAYTIFAAGATDPDYTITYTNGTLTVTPVALTVTADDKGKAYGANVPTLTATYSGFVNGDTSASLTTAPTLSTTATANSPAGTYPITVGGAADPDYIFTYVNGTLTVARYSLIITADNQTKGYGAGLPALTLTYAGFVNGDTPASLTTPPTVTTTATAASHIGSYAINVTGATDSNYAITFVAGNLTVTPVALTVTADDKSKPYGAGLPTLTATYSGFVNGDTPASLSIAPTLTTTATAASHAGGYVTHASGASDPDYTIRYADGTLTVTPVALVVTPDDKSKLYGAALPALTVSYAGFVNGDTLSSLTTAATASTAATSASHAGTYAINASGASDPDYTITYGTGTLTVGAAILTVTADDKSKPYGAGLPTLTATYSGFVNGDTPSSLTTAPTLSTNATAASHVGSYATSAAGAVDPDYVIHYVNGTLTVSPVALAVTADDKTKPYGAALPALTASYRGFVNGDTPSSLTTPPTFSATATAASHVGSYAIMAFGAVDPDYTITYNNGNLTVTAVALTATPDNTSKAYGAALPAFTVSYSGFVNGDTPASLSTAPTVTTTATAGSHVGSYGINASGAADPDYTISYGSGSLQVTPAALTITADDKTKAAGDPLPTLTASYSGFVNGDTPSSLTTKPTITTTATAASQAGTYPITAANAADPDYTFRYVSGTLTVTSSSSGLTVSASTANSVYGQPVTFTATVPGNPTTGAVQFAVDGVALGSPVPVSNGVAQSPAVATLAVGSHAVTASYADASGGNGRSGSLTGGETVSPASTSTMVASSANPTAAGQPVTLTATVSVVAPGGGVPQGSVVFSANGATLGTATLAVVNGFDQASITLSSLPVGTTTVTARYVNTGGNHLGSSGTIAQTVAGAGLTVVGSQLVIVGGDTSDYAQISPAGAKSDGTTGLQVSATLNNTYVSKTFSQAFTSIAVFGLNGNDNIQLSSSLTLPTTVVEGNGNNYVSLGGGNDSVTFGTGSNQVFGGAGDKTVVDHDAAGTSAYVQFGNGNHTITFGAGNDQVQAGNGNNTITAPTGNGNDSLQLGNGNQTVSLPGNGNDYVKTGDGTIVVVVGSGNANLQLGNGTASVTAGNGNNYLKAGNGPVTVVMGKGNDNVQLGDGANTVTLGDGNDYLSAGNANNTVTVGNGNDNVQLGNGDNVVVEGNGNDYVSAGNGANLVVGGLGQHTIQLGNGNDILVDGSVTLTQTGDSLRQILNDWKASASAAVNARIKVTYNAAHPNYLSAGSGRNWFFYTYSKTTSNKKATDRLN